MKKPYIFEIKTVTQQDMVLEITAKSSIDHNVLVIKVLLYKCMSSKLHTPLSTHIDCISDRKIDICFVSESRSFVVKHLTTQKQRFD